jgi:hypothetical protein
MGSPSANNVVTCVLVSIAIQPQATPRDLTLTLGQGRSAKCNSLPRTHTQAHTQAHTHTGGTCVVVQCERSIASQDRLRLLEQSAAIDSPRGH